MKFRLGTRKSALALKQASFIQEVLKKKSVETELVLIESEGDQQSEIPLYEIPSETPGLFTKRLEKALLEKKIDLAVHSFKDLPTTQPQGLEVIAVTERESVSDCVLCLESFFDPSQYLGLSEQAKVGTSSLRRQAQLSAVRPDLELVSIRGNVPTRLEVLKSKKVDAIVLAEAGLNRLNLDLTGVRRQVLPISQFVPAPAQGALAVEIRKDSHLLLKEALQSLNDPISRACTSIEREIMRQLEGGCTLPLGVYCQKDEKGFSVQAFLGVGRDGHWTAFHHFDFQSISEETLISQTVSFFRSKPAC